MLPSLRQEKQIELWILRWCLDALAVCILLSGFCSMIALSKRDPSGTRVTYAILTAWVADTAALLIGSALGKHRIMSKLSPKKTLEGK